MPPNEDPYRTLKSVVVGLATAAVLGAAMHSFRMDARIFVIPLVIIAAGVGHWVYKKLGTP
jgi:hypothetical protein